MKTSLGVCLAAMTLTAVFTPFLGAQSLPLQKGISVELAVTRNAVPMPEADRQDALIVAITHDGRVFLRVDPVGPAALAAGVKASEAKEPEKKFYLKADARTPYANVARVLGALRTADVESLILLTAQPGAQKQGARVPPYGLKVHIALPSHYGSAAAVVRVLNAGQQTPRLKINNQQVSWTELQGALGRLLQDRREKTVLVRAEGALPFNRVVRVADVCRSLGARVVLEGP
jgi:biopolymer transport protein TolR